MFGPTRFELITGYASLNGMNTHFFGVFDLNSEILVVVCSCFSILAAFFYQTPEKLHSSFTND